MMFKEAFVWAENEKGEIVHVDDVPRGALCNCICPNCHEKVIARQGSERAHGFAHASAERGANLAICMMVIMFKLAEQIIKTEKRIRVPSYYGIFKSRVIEFENVEVDGRFEREDRQPDIIATTKDNRKYLIEFIFRDFPRHRQRVDVENMNCLEVDLEGQSINDRNSLKDFLLESDQNRKWLNNNTYFNSIEELYSKSGKDIRLVASDECSACPVRRKCCAVREKIGSGGYKGDFLIIIHNEIQYRLCKTEKYNEIIIDDEKEREADRKCREENLKRYQKIKQQRHIREGKEDAGFPVSEKSEKNQRELQKSFRNVVDVKEGELSCFNCEYALPWAHNGEMTQCGRYVSLGLPERICHNHAMECSCFKIKSTK